MIRSYPDLKKEYQQLHEQTVTASISGMPGSGGAARKTEDIAIKELPRSKQIEYDAVRRAIEVTGMLKTGAARLRIVDMVFWRQSHTLDGAALAVNYSYDSAKIFHGDFIMTVAYFRGLITYEEYKNDTNITLKSH
jgi:hypothetical protein